jgi:hypothetical protein
VTSARIHEQSEIPLAALCSDQTLYQRHIDSLSDDSCCHQIFCQLQVCKVRNALVSRFVPFVGACAPAVISSSGSNTSMLLSTTLTTASRRINANDAQNDANDSNGQSRTRLEFGRVALEFVGWSHSDKHFNRLLGLRCCSVRFQSFICH